MNLSRKVKSILVQSNYKPHRKKDQDKIKEMEEYLENLIKNGFSKKNKK